MTRVAERGRTVYVATIYHDSEDNASDDWRDIGYYPSLAAAVKAVNAAKDPARGWYTGGVQRGEFYPAKFGVRPERFDDDGRGSWYVGLDGRPLR